MSYAVESLEAVTAALDALASPEGQRLIASLRRLARELDEALGPAPMRLRIRTTFGPVVLEFGEGV